ncbi:MAG: hypothetical protein IJK18_04390 [Clostridia bacterium]|nr:hypothetical protein [Clostridia bacterium]
MNKLEIEIASFKEEVLTTGMTMSMYLNKKKSLINKIECFSNKSLMFFQQLYFIDLINRQQYLDMKIKVDKSRKHYKSMLSII